jgi:hypothetical protein
LLPVVVGSNGRVVIVAQNFFGMLLCWHGHSIDGNISRTLALSGLKHRSIFLLRGTSCTISELLRLSN